MRSVIGWSISIGDWGWVRTVLGLWECRPSIWHLSSGISVLVYTQAYSWTHHPTAYIFLHYRTQGETKCLQHASMTRSLHFFGRSILEKTVWNCSEVAWLFSQTTYCYFLGRIMQTISPEYRQWLEVWQGIAYIFAGTLVHVNWRNLRNCSHCCWTFDNCTCTWSRLYEGVWEHVKRSWCPPPLRSGLPPQGSTSSCHSSTFRGGRGPSPNRGQALSHSIWKFSEPRLCSCAVCPYGSYVILYAVTNTAANCRGRRERTNCHCYHCNSTHHRDSGTDHGSSNYRAGSPKTAPGGRGNHSDFCCSFACIFSPPWCVLSHGQPWSGVFGHFSWRRDGHQSGDGRSSYFFSPSTTTSSHFITYNPCANCVRLPFV